MKKIFQFEPNLGEEEKQELVSVIDSGWYTEAGKTREFERMFASYQSCRKIKKEISHMWKIL